MTAKEISDRILAGIDDDPSAPGSIASDGTPVPPEIMAAINEGQELFSWLTLCLEAIAPITLPASTTFGMIRATLPDFLVPLRLSIGGARVKPATPAELDALDDSWQNRVGVPGFYFTWGFNFYAVTPQPANDTVSQLTYARAPLQLVDDAWPEIPEQYHQSLVKYGRYRVKLKEGGRGLERGLVQFKEFLADATAHADYVRARSRAARYDTLPIELKLFDRARVVKPR